MSKRFNQLLAKCQKLNSQMLSIVAGGGEINKDTPLFIENFRDAVKELPAKQAGFDSRNGFDTLQLQDSGFEESDRIPSLKLFAQIDKQREFLEKLAQAKSPAKSKPRQRLQAAV